MRLIRLGAVHNMPCISYVLASEGCLRFCSKHCSYTHMLTCFDAAHDAAVVFIVRLALCSYSIDCLAQHDNVCEADKIATVVAPSLLTIL